LGTSGAALATTIPYVLNAGVSVMIYWCRISRDVTAIWRIRREDLRHLVRSVLDRTRGAALPGSGARFP